MLTYYLCDKAKFPAHPSDNCLVLSQRDLEKSKSQSIILSPELTDPCNTLKFKNLEFNLFLTKKV